MTTAIPAIPCAARHDVLKSTIAITLGSILASEAVTFGLSAMLDLRAGLPAFLMAGLIPALLAAPASYWQLLRMQQIRQAYRELERVASIDWLTSCLNRRAFNIAAQAACDAGRGALLIVDADAFKEVNDTFGHEHGDDALRLVAAVLREGAGDAARVGRIGGEEFGIFVPDLTPPEALQLAEDLRRAVEAIAFAPEAAPHRLTVSIGVATSDAPAPFANLLHIADQQLYVAKRNGRNRVSIAAAGDVATVRAAA